MSYFADHLAWQQRVAQEFKASSQYTSMIVLTMCIGLQSSNCCMKCVQLTLTFINSIPC